jgi:uncharacterized membrane protein YphA (DoxX/SURF4 family)
MTNDYAAAFGRLMIATLFLLGGLGKIAAPAATQAYIASTGLPLPIAGYLIAVAVEIGTCRRIARIHVAAAHFGPAVDSGVAFY